MTVKKMYRYLGRNGILTTRILLDGINHIPMLELIASEGMVLTNGEVKVHNIVIEEADRNLWREIADNTN